MSDPMSTPAEVPAAAAPPQPGYEFSATDNVLLGELAGYGRSMSFVAILLGALAFVVGMLTLEVFCLLQALLSFCVGTWIRRAADSFQQIVDTRENDIPHLMAALRQLRNVLALFYYLVLFASVLFLILLVIILVIGLRGYFAPSAQGVGDA